MTVSELIELLKLEPKDNEVSFNGLHLIKIDDKGDNSEFIFEENFFVKDGKVFSLSQE